MAKTFEYIEIEDTSSARAVEIPDPAEAGTGAEVLVKDASGGAETNNITVSPVSGEIDGGASYVIDEDFGYVRLRSNGVTWRVIGQSATATAP